jgi:hypothetical protein
MTAACALPRSEPANSQAYGREQLRAVHARPIVAQAVAAVVKKAREDVDEPEHVVHGLGQSLPRSRFHPVDEIIHQRRDLLATRGHARLGQQAVDRTLGADDFGCGCEKKLFWWNAQ